MFWKIFAESIMKKVIAERASNVKITYEFVHSILFATEASSAWTIRPEFFLVNLFR